MYTIQRGLPKIGKTPDTCILAHVKLIETGKRVLLYNNALCKGENDESLHRMLMYFIYTYKSEKYIT